MPLPQPSSSVSVGFDVGGTFTDVVIASEEAVVVEKVLTTPEDPSIAARDGIHRGLQRLGLEAADVTFAIHGTTLVANAIIQRRGAKTALITTRGFRDIIEIGHGTRYDIYDLHLPFPRPMVERRLRCEVSGRVTADGTIAEPVDENEIRAVLTALRDEDVQSVAICFLHSYANSSLEEEVRRLGEREFPELTYSTSAELTAEVGEYERFSTAVANAYVQPPITEYLRMLDEWFGSGKLLLMNSTGGTIGVESARQWPIQLIESGPAAGVIAAATRADEMGREQVVSFDMGGTTAKICVIKNGSPERAQDFEAARLERFKPGSGIPLKVPVVDLLEIGAGGGSIARIDDLGLLKVGPTSAGADPGPACYGRGGTEPTVTDASLILGLLGEESFLGGEMSLRRSAAEEAVDRLAQALGLSLVQTAAGILDVVNETMASAMRIHVVEGNNDPRGFSLMAFGGAGPLHAAALARTLGMQEAIVPFGAGVASAQGLLMAPPMVDLSQTYSSDLDLVEWETVQGVYERLENRGRTILEETGVPADDIAFTRSVDIQYAGQAHEITVGFPEDQQGESLGAALGKAFERAYAELYTHLNPGFPIEVSTWRLRASGLTHVTRTQASGQFTAKPQPQKTTRDVFFSSESGYVNCPVYAQQDLEPSRTYDGPAIVEQREATTVVPRGDRFSVDRDRTLFVHLTPCTMTKSNTSTSTPMDSEPWDPVTLEIMWQRLLSCATQASRAILRTSFSSVVTSSHDFRYILTDETGDTLALSHLGEVMFVTTFPDCVKEILRQVGRDNIHPGDVYITNDPWIAAGHLPDIHVATPVFKDGRLVAFSGSVIHISDIGGRFGAHDAREVFEEGICFPIMRLYTRGQLNEDVIRILRANVRAPQLAHGDVMAQVAGNQQGANLLLTFLDDYGLDDVRQLACTLNSRVERAMRERIRELPDGEYERTTIGETGCSGEEFTIHSVIRIDGDTVTVDYAGSSPQTETAGINCVLNCTRSMTLYPFQMLLLPHVPVNQGASRPIKVLAEPGSIMNALRPAAVDVRAMVTHLLPDHIIGSLADVIPERVRATGGVRWLLLADRTWSDTGRRTITSFFQAGALGATARSDGKSATFYPIKSYHTPVERFETDTGLRVIEKSLRCDSGGPGKFRGGLGQRIVLRNPTPDPVAFTFYRMQMKHAARGYGGGADGATGRAEVDGKPFTSAVLRLQPGSEATVETPGGGGFGDPGARSREQVEWDVLQGYVSAEAANTIWKPPDSEKTGL